MLSIAVIVYIATAILVFRWAMDVDMRAFGEDFDTGFDIITGILWPIGVPILAYRIYREYPEDYRRILTGRINNGQG